MVRTVDGSTDLVNLKGGSAGQIPYQSAASKTAFAGPGTSGQVLTSNGGGIPTFQAAPAATNAINLTGGTVGQVPYQSNPNLTSFTGPGTSGQYLKSNGAAPPSFASITQVPIAGSIAGGDAGQVVYQYATGVSGTTNTGISGQVLTSSGTSAPFFANPTSAFSTAITSTDTTESTSDTTGSVRTNGGIAALKNIYGGGRLVTAGYLQTDSVFNATSASNGSLRVTNGGMGCAQDCFVGGVVKVNSTTDSTSDTTGSVITKGGIAALKNIYGGGRIVSAGYIQTDSFFNATSASNGSLRVTNGGMGCAQDCFVGGTVTGNRVVCGTDITCNSVKVPSSSPKTAIDAAGSVLKINGSSDFSAVQINNLSTVNTLPFIYEIGLFSPTFIPINPADDANFPTLINTTYVTQIGRYTRIGNSLTIYVEVEWRNSNGLNLIGIALEKGVPYTIRDACCAIYGLNYNMEPVTPFGIDDGIPISTFNPTTQRFEQLSWVNGTDRAPYLFVNGNGPIIGNYRIAYTMNCYVV